MKYEFSYVIVRNDEIEFESTAEVSLTKKDFAEMEQFIKEHDYAWEFVDIPGYIYDKCMNFAYEKALKEFPDFSYPENGYELQLQDTIPDSFLEKLSEETREKVYENIPEEYFDNEEDEDEETEDQEEEFPEPTKENTLYLTIKQTFFDQIVEGTKKEEYREIKETTYKKYLQVDEGGFPIWFTDLEHDTERIEEGDICVWNEGEYPYVPQNICYLDLAVGYKKERDTAKVKVVGISFDPLMNEKGKAIRFNFDEETGVHPCENGELCFWQIVYHLGEVVDLHRK